MVRENQLLLLALAAVCLFLLIWGHPDTVTVTPNIPEPPRGGVYYSYFDDLTISVKGVTIRVINFTDPNPMNLNAKAMIGNKHPRTIPRSLELRQELDDYANAGSARLSNIFESVDELNSFNVTAWFMVPSSNLDVYVGGHATTLTIDLGGAEGNATIITNIDWNSLGSRSNGLGQYSWVNYANSSLSMNRTDPTISMPPISFDAWHPLSVVYDGEQVGIYVDGVLYEYCDIHLANMCKLNSIELSISPHAYV